MFTNVCRRRLSTLRRRIFHKKASCASKTLEGLVGGVLSASVLAAALWWITPFAAWQAAILALTANAMGFFGGLVLSAIKCAHG